MKDLQLHNNFFIKAVLIRKLVHMKAIHINFVMCSYETKIGITRSGNNLNGHPEIHTIQGTKIVLIMLFQFCLWLFTIYHA